MKNEQFQRTSELLVWPAAMRCLPVVRTIPALPETIASRELDLTISSAGIWKDWRRKLVAEEWALLGAGAATDPTSDYFVLARTIGDVLVRWLYKHPKHAGEGLLRRRAASRLLPFYRQAAVVGVVPAPKLAMTA